MGRASRDVTPAFYTSQLESRNQTQAGCVTTDGVEVKMNLAGLNRIAWSLLLALVLCACNRSSSPKEPPITGKASDPPTAMPVKWQTGWRYIYRAETVTSSQVPRRNTGLMIQTENVLNQDLAFTVTNGPAEGRRVLTMELLAVQMETSRDDGMTMSFDSGNKVMAVDDSPLAERLKKLVGLKLIFHVAADNSITRVDGVRELSDRVSNNNNPVRGVAAGILARYFNQQFYREIVEMGMLPKDPVKVGASWVVTRQAGAASGGASSPLEVTYEFRGWQKKDGTNCARLDFTGEFKPSAIANTLAPTSLPANLRRAGRMANPPKVEGTMTGRSWYSPDIGLAVETSYDQSTTVTATTVRRQRNRGDTNVVDVVDLAVSTNDVPTAPATNAPGQNVTTTTTTSSTTAHQHVNVKLVEIEPTEK